MAKIDSYMCDICGAKNIFPVSVSVSNGYDDLGETRVIHYDFCTTCAAKVIQKIENINQYVIALILLQSNSK